MGFREVLTREYWCDWCGRYDEEVHVTGQGTMRDLETGWWVMAQRKPGDPTWAGELYLCPGCTSSIEQLEVQTLERAAAHGPGPHARPDPINGAMVDPADLEESLEGRLAQAELNEMRERAAFTSPEKRAEAEEAALDAEAARKRNKGCTCGHGWAEHYRGAGRCASPQGCDCDGFVAEDMEMP